MPVIENKWQSQTVGTFIKSILAFVQETIIKLGVSILENVSNTNLLNMKTNFH